MLTRSGAVTLLLRALSLLAVLVRLRCCDVGLRVCMCVCASSSAPSLVVRARVRAANTLAGLLTSPQLPLPLSLPLSHGCVLCFCREPTKVLACWQ